MKEFHALTDAELDSARVTDGDLLVKLYRDLRDHHVRETAHLAARDRSAILRMAGNIAGGIEANTRVDWDADTVAVRAVAVARAIVAKVDDVDDEENDA